MYFCTLYNTLYYIITPFSNLYMPSFWWATVHYSFMRTDYVHPNDLKETFLVWHIRAKTLLSIKFLGQTTKHCKHSRNQAVSPVKHGLCLKSKTLTTFKSIYESRKCYRLVSRTELCVAVNLSWENLTFYCKCKNSTYAMCSAEVHGQGICSFYCWTTD